MAKRKHPGEQKARALIVRGGWQLRFADGTVLHETRPLTRADAVRLSLQVPVFAIGYAYPTRDITGQPDEITKELALVRDPEVYELNTNSASLFRSLEGDEALVLQFNH